MPSREIRSAPWRGHMVITIKAKKFVHRSLLKLIEAQAAVEAERRSVSSTDALPRHAGGYPAPSTSGSADGVGLGVAADDADLLHEVDKRRERVFGGDGFADISFP